MKTHKLDFQEWLAALPSTEEQEFTLNVPITLPLSDWLQAANCAKRDGESIGYELGILLQNVDWDPI